MMMPRREFAVWWLHWLGVFDAKGADEDFWTAKLGKSSGPRHAHGVREGVDG